jgi:hypothetical protein
MQFLNQIIDRLQIEDQGRTDWTMEVKMTESQSCQAEEDQLEPEMK